MRSLFVLPMTVHTSCASSRPWRVRLALLALAFGPAAHAFDFADVGARAQTLAQKPYEAPVDQLPPSLRGLNYDQYRDIRFKPERARWRSAQLPFELQFFHPGFNFQHGVKINLIKGADVTPVQFNPANFDYGHTVLNPSELEDLDYAGFRIHTRLNRKDYLDELATFLGASYFRALGKGQRYGLSARGLAVDTAEMSGEEFPAFTEFWIVEPEPAQEGRADEIVVYALLDSRRVSGAYQFTLRPGVTTRIDVRARLYLRKAVTKLGIAPLTSMFYFGNGQSPVVDDYRPEVHDSEGLSIRNGNDEWIWRPLVNPNRLLVTSFGLENPKGFGLMQRNHDFDNYQDLEARYDLRPSVWVEPKGPWGRGRVELVQIPTPDETNDNVVAYWVPDALPAEGEPLDLQYRLSWQHREMTAPPNSRVVKTLRGHGWRARDDDGSLRFMVDFEGPALRKLAADAPLTPQVWIGDNGELLEKQLYRNEVTGGWRLSLRCRRDDAKKPTEMRALLRQGDSTVSETWSYILPAGPEN